MAGGACSSAKARLLEALTDAVLVLRGDVVEAASDGADRRIGTGVLAGATLQDLVHPDDAPPSPGEPTTHVRLFVPTGGNRWFEATRVPTDDGSVLAVRDVHERVERERALQISRRRLHDALDVSASMQQQELLARTYEDAAQVHAALEAALHATSDSFAVYKLVRDAAGEVERIVVRLMNTAAALPLGHDPEELRGRDLLEVFPDLQRCGLWEAIVASVEERRPRRHRVHIDDDQGAWAASYDNTVAPLGEDQVVVTWRDVTLDEQGRRELERTRSQAEHAASHDHLTGLPNRWRLEQRLLEALAGTALGRRVAVVFCDLDDFKAVNDSYGHPAGDALLREVAARLLQLTRSRDTAARLAGDEFVLVLCDLPAGWEPRDFVRRAREVLGRPVDVGAGVVRPSASVGVVVVDPEADDRTPEALLADADRAMYGAKRARGLRPEAFRDVS
jgi:diguanylate cyclase (GGDEF)-like protein